MISKDKLLLLVSIISSVSILIAFLSPPPQLASASTPVPLIAPTATATLTNALKFEQYASLRNAAKTKGKVRIIVALNVDFQPERHLSTAQAVQSQRASIRQMRSDLSTSLSQFKATVTSASMDWIVPGVSLEVDPMALDYLIASPLVSAISEDRIGSLVDDTGAHLIGADVAWSAGYTGAGQAIAILDSGVQANHDFFTAGGTQPSRIIAEACFSSAGLGERSLCPNGQSVQIGSGAAAPCSPSSQWNNCYHGTAVAGIAAGNGDYGNASFNPNGNNFSGVAKDANIIAINITHGTVGIGVAPYESDVISGLNQV